MDATNDKSAKSYTEQESDSVNQVFSALVHESTLLSKEKVFRTAEDKVH